MPNAHETQAKIMGLAQAAETVRRWQSAGQKVVFSNGCFDLVHLGHIDYLEKARQLGDRLVVGLNSDASVKRLKGAARPLNNEYARARMLAAFAFVDAVVSFGEDTPYSLIQHLVPDILVKGSDYTVENIVGADVVINNGGAVRTIELVSGFSTTHLIETIKKS